jgi:ubiquinol-cytochrome c reductase cytochrome c subunit
VVALTSQEESAARPPRTARSRWARRNAADRPTRQRRRRRFASYVVIVAALVGMGSVYGLATSRSGQAAAGDPSQQVEAGKALYLQGCSSCHGLAAEGGSSAPSLIGVGAAAVDFQLSTGRMPLKQLGAQAVRTQPRYTPEQIADVAAYIASLAPGPSVPGKDQYTPGAKADMGFGGTLFRTNCASCHNFVGAGGALADGKFAPRLDHATDKEIYEAMLTGPGTMPVFSDQQLTPEEKQDIIAFVQGIKAEPDPGGLNLGRSGAVAEGLVAFVAGITFISGIAMWIGARAKRAS